MTHDTRVLIVIDVQNDYFTDGAFPLWHADATLDRIETAIAQAHAQSIPVVLVQHVVRGERAKAGGLFAEHTHGVAIHPRILAAAPDAPIVEKAFADGFWETSLDATLQGLGARHLLIAGMMTQNCVTHTAIAKAAERYTVTVLPECCTTVSEAIHQFAVNALQTRVTLAPAATALA